jgi:hypothetical protein
VFEPCSGGPAVPAAASVRDADWRHAADPLAPRMRSARVARVRTVFWRIGGAGRRFSTQCGLAPRSRPSRSAHALRSGCLSSNRVLGSGGQHVAQHAVAARWFVFCEDWTSRFVFCELQELQWSRMPIKGVATDAGDLQITVETNNQWL